MEATLPAPTDVGGGAPATLGAGADGDHRGFTYFITGASRGIGLEFARVLLKRGDSVIAAVRDPAGASKLVSLAASEQRLRIVDLDVADPDSLKTLPERHGSTPVDVLINNAGMTSKSKKIESIDGAELAKVMMVNSIAPMLVSSALLPHLRSGSRRTIVQISSIMGSIAGNNTVESSYAYRASKAALNQFNRSLAAELRSDGFTCVAMHPGWVRTELGGAGGQLSVEESVATMLRVIDALRADQTGAFLNYDGAPIAW